MKRLTLALLFLTLLGLLPARTQAQGVRFDDVAFRYTSGGTWPAANATITVCSSASGIPCTTPVTVYQDAALSNPCLVTTVGCLLTDSRGNYGFFATSGTTYIITITGTGITGYQKTWVAPIVSGGTGTFTNLTATTGTIPKLGVQSGGYTCYIDGVTWTSVQSAITNGTCGEINDRAVFSTSLGTLSVTRSVKILLGGSKSYTNTGITFSVCGGIIEGLGGDTTWMQYTPTTGTGLTITASQCQSPSGTGLRGVRFLGSGNGNATIGVNMNASSGSLPHAFLEDGDIDSFGTQFECTSGCSFIAFKSFNLFAGNGVGFLYADTNDNEKFSMIDSGVFGSFTNTSWSTCFQITGTHVLNLEFVASSIDYCGFTENNASARVHLAQTYLENTTAVSGANPVVTVTSGMLSLGPGTDVFMSGATCQNWALVNGGTLQIVGGARFNCNGAVGGSVVNASSGNFDYSTNPVMVGFSSYFNPSGAIINASRSAEFGFGGNYVTYGGSAADIVQVFSNNAAGAKGWDMDNAGTGSVISLQAGDLGWYDGTTSWLEYGAGVGGILSGGDIRVGSSGKIKNNNATATMGLTLKKGSGGGNYTNATTSYTVADSTNLCFTVTIPTGWKLAVSASGALSTATAAVVAQAALTDNAACSTANAGILVETAPIQGAGIGIAGAFALNWVITGDGNAHNIALQFKTSNAADTASLINSSATITPTMVFQLEPSN